MIRQVTVTDLQRNAAKVISELEKGPVVVSQRGRPAAVIIDTKTFERIERELDEVERQRVIEIVRAGMADYKAGRVLSHAEVVRRVRKRRAAR
ncbi:MAG TPA: type II toxin-antitoxin system Phd/YefM family antitoxin [Blastocatellia bacterium]|jgi:prevent-host-death family protein